MTMQRLPPSHPLKCATSAPNLSRTKIRGLQLFLETNIAPDKGLFSSMVLTPMSTVIEAVTKLTSSSELTGQIAEVHGESVTMRPPPNYVDQDTEKNIENFWRLGYA